jgi:hypothetical protein
MPKQAPAPANAGRPTFSIEAPTGMLGTLAARNGRTCRAARRTDAGLLELVTWGVEEGAGSVVLDGLTDAECALASTTFRELVKQRPVEEPGEDGEEEDAAEPAPAPAPPSQAQMSLW